MLIIVDRNVDVSNLIVDRLLRVEFPKNELVKVGILFFYRFHFFYDVTQGVIFYPAGAYIK